MRINTHVGNVDIKLNTDRISKNLREAQIALNEMVVAQSEEFVPTSGGELGLRGSVNYPDGIAGGVIEYNTPYAHYLYTGLLYEGSYPIKDSAGNIIGWRSKKHKTPTNKPLKYHTKGTGPEWFETAKSRFKDEWVRKVKEIAGQD